MSSEPELRFRDSSWASISAVDFLCVTAGSRGMRPGSRLRSEEHTSELQSQSNLVCRLLLEKKKNHSASHRTDGPSTAPREAERKAIPVDPVPQAPRAAGRTAPAPAEPAQPSRAEPDGVRPL